MGQGEFRFSINYDPPIAWGALLKFIGVRGAHSAEQVENGLYRRTVELDAVRGWVTVEHCRYSHSLTVALPERLQEQHEEVQKRLTHLFDLWADSSAIDDHLKGDPILARSVEFSPGIRVPGAFDGFEVAMRAVLGQQISVRAATTLFARLTTLFGKKVATPFPDLAQLTPSAFDIANASHSAIGAIGLTSRRAETLISLARSVCDGFISFDGSLDCSETCRKLMTIRGIGPWTASYIALRALGDKDAFPDTDLVIKKRLKVHGEASIAQLSARWRPYRGYAAMRLWRMA
ncbi:AraC family transcriptional regulator [Salinisphaera sp. C84B14]|uniref:DNA-3-methyladenine glycosylase family protein n=1 Tax=Salinisphaera sp. C84B14 TaxID=1304155 RepID=UPI00333F4710